MADIKKSQYHHMTAGFVILHYGKMDVTKRCLGSIFSLDGVDDAEIVVVDNDPCSNPAVDSLHAEDSAGCAHSADSGKGANTDAAFDARNMKSRLKWERYLKRPNFHLIRTGGGKGFSEANNIGYGWLRKHYDVQAVIIGNNDLVFDQKDFLLRVFQIKSHFCDGEEPGERSACERMPFDLCGPDIIVKGAGVHQNPMGRHLPTGDEARRTIRLNETALKLMPFSYPYVSRWFGRMEQTGDAGEYEKTLFYPDTDSKAAAGHADNKILYCDNVKRKELVDRPSGMNPLVLQGSCLIFGGRFLKEEEKAFWPETNFYYEEYILTKRCMDKGYRIVYNPSLKVLHDSGRASHDSVRSRMEYVKRKLRNTADACRVYLDYISKA